MRTLARWIPAMMTALACGSDPAASQGARDAGTNDAKSPTSSDAEVPTPDASFDAGKDANADAGAPIEISITVGISMQEAMGSAYRNYRDVSFTSTPSGGAFECSVDMAAFAACTSPVRVKGGGALCGGFAGTFGSPVNHAIRVRVADAASPGGFAVAEKTFSINEC